ncbi:MAG TPA: helix-turn-helix domain-containing protein [Bacteroidales bacterium]|nr:helix-turn-helix domain-containing protein [Bacteroidales bacterium]
MATHDEQSKNKPLFLEIPMEFYEDMDRRIKKAVAEAIGDTDNLPYKAKYLTRKEVCQLLNITLPTLHSYCKKGIIKGQKVGNRILFTEQQIQDSLHDLSMRFSKR